MKVLQAPDGCVDIQLRPMVCDDEFEWDRVRVNNEGWLSPWQSTEPLHKPGLTFNQWLQSQHMDEQRGVGATFLIHFQMHIVGQISLGAISYGAMRTGLVGYWVSRQYIGQGIAPTALALLSDWAFKDVDGPQLHRLEIAILPENKRSLRVAEKVGAHSEGLRQRYMYINGSWRDHVTFSLLADDVGDGVVSRLMTGR